ncbi:MAG: hypothetical protein HDR87_08430 [Bacteroides sp.]|nr:hypothetical protein [Bacteroides sp.]
MAKTYGGIRHVGVVNQSEYAINKAIFELELASGNYNIEKSYLSPSGAYVLLEKGHQYHEDEMEAAIAMADSGIIVRLEKEGDPSRATRIDEDGNFKFSEGTLSIERLTYEQSTRTSITTTAERSVKKALEHAKDKGSEICVIYDKGGVFHRNDIHAGIQLYESFKNNDSKRFKSILVIDKNHNVHEWTHDK